MAKAKALRPDELFRRCDPDELLFETTEEITPLKAIIGQERALRSLEFGLGLSNHGYNIYVLGEGGTGKISTVKDMLEKRAVSEERPDDWCYIFNFKDSDVPNSLRLPPGKGKEFKRDMEFVLASLKRDVPKVFDSKDYEQHRDEIVEGQQERTKEIFYKLEQTANEKGFLLKKSAGGLSIVPAKDGKSIKQQEYDDLSKAERDAIDATMHFLQDRLGAAIREARNVEKNARERIKRLDHEMVLYVVNPLIDDLLEKYKDNEQVARYLVVVKKDLLLHIDEFRPREELEIQGLKLPVQTKEDSFERYAVNLIVDNGEPMDCDTSADSGSADSGSRGGAPVVIETNPTYSNLFGRIEHRFQYGMAVTDFTMIKPGAVHRANGGYLVVHALDILRNLFVYDALKRMIKNKEARVEDAWEQYRAVSSSALRPEPIPIDIKIIMIGEPYIYYLLNNYDTEFGKLFKVKADFDSEMVLTDDVVLKYAEFIATRCAEEELLHFDRSAVARIVEYGIRFAGDKEKVTARFNDIANIVTEASYWASKDGAELVSDAHVERAHNERKFRNSKIEEKIREYITEDTIMVDTAGGVVGQVNGLAVLDMGDHSFGRPSRVTAKTFLGDSGVVNIEREVKMSGRIHDKALLILSSFLAGRFAQKVPLMLSATVCFEQLYGEIEGDSATCTEIYAIMSSITSVEIDQSIAVTGSMNQLGEVQPIGGVNEKIEGFFDLCKAKEGGLTGTQGVIIPRRNVKNLMLKREVIEAAEAGKFAIYPIDMVDEGLEILTGKEVGEQDSKGLYAKGTLNRIAVERLKVMATSYRTFGRPKPGKKSVKDEDANNDNKDVKKG